MVVSARDSNASQSAGHMHTPVTQRFFS